MTTKTNPIIWFDGRDSTRQLPPECIAECSASGDQYDTVKFWVEKLNFDGPVDQFKEYLDGFGCWDDEQLKISSYSDMNSKVSFEFMDSSLLPTSSGMMGWLLSSMTCSLVC